MELVTYHWSGKHRRVVRGINLQTLLWTDGKALISCDFRVYAKAQDGKSKNDHFQAMLKEAKERNFEPGFVVFQLVCQPGKPEDNPRLRVALANEVEE